MGCLTSCYMTTKDKRLSTNMQNNKSTNKNKNHTSKTTYAQQLVVEQPHLVVEHNTPVPRKLTEVSKKKWLFELFQL